MARPTLQQRTRETQQAAADQPRAGQQEDGRGEQHHGAVEGLLEIAATASLLSHRQDEPRQDSPDHHAGEPDQEGVPPAGRRAMVGSAQAAIPSGSIPAGYP